MAAQMPSCGGQPDWKGTSVDASVGTGQSRVFLQAMQWGRGCDVAGRERWRERAVVTAAARARSGDRGGYSEAAQLKL